MATLDVEARALPRVSSATRRAAQPVALAAVLLAPTLVFLLVFTYWPLVVSVVGSFQRFGRVGSRADLGRTAELPGPLARRALPPGAGQHGPVRPDRPARSRSLFGLVAAVAVDGHRRLRLAARTLIFHPVLLPTVAIAATWLFLLNPVSGPVADPDHPADRSRPGLAGGSRAPP